MKRSLTVFVTFLTFWLGYAQNPKTIDSLKKVLESRIAKEEEAKIYASLAEEYMYSDSLQTTNYANRALDISESINYTIGMIRAMHAVGWVNMQRGYFDKAQISFDRAMKMAEQVNSQKEKIRILNAYGMLHWNKGEYDRSRTYFDETLTLSENLDDDAGVARALGNIGLVLGDQNQPKEAIDYLLRSFELKEAIGDKRGASQILNSLCVDHKNLGNYDLALQYGFSALEYKSEVGDSIGIAVTYNNIGTVFDNKGLPDSALFYYHESLYIKERVGDKKGMASNLNNIGVIYRRAGNLSQALEYYNKSLRIRIELGDKRYIASNYNNIAIVYIYQGDFPHALEYFFKSLEINKELGDKRGMATAYGNIGNVNSDLENYEQAKEYFLKAVDINREIGHKKSTAIDLNNLGSVYLTLGDAQIALDYLSESLQINEEIGYKSGISFTSYNIGRAYSELEIFTEALKHLSRSYQLRRELNQRIDMARPLILMGEIHRIQRRHSTAKNYLSEALSIAQEIGIPELIKDASEELSQVEYELGNHRQAYELSVLSKQMSDSLNIEESGKKLTRLQAEFDFQQEKDSIQFANENQRLVLERDIAKRKANQRALIGGLTFAGLLVIVLFLFYRSKQRSNARLAQLNIEVTNQRDDLDKLNSLRTKFFSIIAHDLRGPLIGLQGTREKLEYFIRKEKWDRLMDVGGKIEESVDGLNQLLNNLLNWAMTETGELPYHPERINSKTLLEENVALYKNAAEAKEVTFQSKATDLDMEVDSNTVSTIVRNILSNAVKFTKTGGKITLTNSIKDDFIEIAIKDEGPGMSMNKVDAILNGGEKSELGSQGEQGLGLGLRLSQEFIKLNKGKLEIKSEEGKGTIFKILLPAG